MTEQHHVSIGKHLAEQLGQTCSGFAHWYQFLEGIPSAIGIADEATKDRVWERMRALRFDPRPHGCEANAGLPPGARALAHEVRSFDALFAENRGATMDTMVGLTDIATMHGFTRQRAHELSQHPTFPASHGKVGKSAVWRLVDVERWFQIPRKPGRPKKESSAAAHSSPKGSRS